MAAFLDDVARGVSSSAREAMRSRGIVVVGQENPVSDPVSEPRSDSVLKSDWNVTFGEAFPSSRARFALHGVVSPNGGDKCGGSRA